MAGVERIHIIGRSRSGTTMLHLAMGCFANVMLSEKRPIRIIPSSASERGSRYAWAGGPGENSHHQANSGWYKPKHRDALIALTRLNIGLIYMIRIRNVMLASCRFQGGSEEAM